MRRLKVNGLRGLVHAGALLPLAWLIWQFNQDQLTANPIREIQLRTGKYALSMLLASLACTPIYHISGFEPLLQVRRTLGLYAFGYASLHFLNFIGLDYGFNFSLIKDAISANRFVLAGLASFFILTMLAVTSTRGWVKRLGKNWKSLHRLVYAAAVFAIIHYVWTAKSTADLRLPLVYGAVLALLLVVRIPVIKNLFSWRSRSP